jgi:hypothetical protein
MVIMAAWWGLGYAALLVATVIYGRFILRYRTAQESQTLSLTGQILATISTLTLWIGLLSRAIKGHGWPLVSPADTTTGIALFILLAYIAWKLFAQERGAGFFVTTIALLLLSYGLGRQSPGPITHPFASKGMLLSNVLNLCGGSFLALATATSLTNLLFSRRAPHMQEQGKSTAQEPRETASEVLVRGALLCLAVGLAIDTWWLQKVGLGSSNDAQQAGIAIAWMIFFVALRLRANSYWRGWPWTTVLSAGFVCVLPILMNVPWLENTLPI